MIGNENTANVANQLQGGLMTLFGGQPSKSTSSDIEGKLAMMEYKNQLSRDNMDYRQGIKTTNPLDDELKRAQITSLNEGLTAPTPPGFTRAGGKVAPDPTYIKPSEQRMIDKEQREVEEAEKQRAYAEDNLKENAAENLRTIEEVKKGSKYFGPFGNMPSIQAPSSLFGEYGARKNWEANVNKLLSQKVIDVMGEMKKASKTGASGFGQLSEKELAVLQGASTALKRDLNPEDALKYLDEIERIHKKVLGQDVGGNDFENPYGNMKSKPSFVSGVGNEMPSFNTPEEAESSGYKGIVMIGGKRARID